MIMMLPEHVERTVEQGLKLFYRSDHDKRKAQGLSESTSANEAGMGDLSKAPFGRYMYFAGDDTKVESVAIRDKCGFFGGCVA